MLLLNNQVVYATSPLDQFEIRNYLNLDSSLFKIDLSITNIGLYLITGTMLVLLVSFIANNNNKIIANS
jgi:F0F1-type ATP synthase membrane subunit a